DDAEALRKRVNHLLDGIAELQMTQRVVSAGSAHTVTGIVGCTPDIQKVRKWEVVPGGRFISHEDVTRMAHGCLSGQTVNDKLFPGGKQAVGQVVRVDRMQFRVIGVLQKKGRSLNGADQDDQLFVPLTTLQHTLMGNDQNLSMILTTVRSEDQTEKAKAEIQKVLAEQHKLRGGSAKNFDVSSVQEVAELAVVVTTTLHVLVLVIASISLLVGGIGVMNI